MIPVTGMRMLCVCLVVMVLAGGALAQQPGAMSENFDAGQPQGWEFMGGASVANAGRGGALVFSSEGVALWLAANVTNFAMQFSYLPPQEGGMAQVMFRMGGEPPNNGEYQVRFEGSEMSLFRMGGNQEQWLCSGQAKWTAGQWQTIAVTAAGGTIQVSVGGQLVLSAVDPQPLGAGIVGFGSPTGMGVAFDNISITSSGGTAAIAQPMGGTTAAPTQPVQPGNLTPTQPMQTISQPVGGPGGGPAAGAQGMYLRFGQIVGGSMAANFRGWSDVLHYAFDISIKPGAKRAVIVPLVVTKYVDRASPLLRVACCNGEPFTEILLVSGGADYMKITLTDARIVSITGDVYDENNIPTEIIEFSAGSVRWEYTMRSNTGQPVAPVKGGWNIKANTQM